MKVVITGTSRGMGYETAKKFLSEGHEVIGIDILPSSIEDKNYTHYVADISDKACLPKIDGVNILINNAGCQTASRKDLDVNVYGVLNCTELYGLQPDIKSILNQASVSATTGDEMPEYVFSKGGVKAYTRWTAKAIAKYGATCNSLSFGGVTTPLNQPVMDDPACWDEIMMVTPLKKWASEREAADWIYFMTMINRSCTGQDIIIDNGESNLGHFVWPTD